MSDPRWARPLTEAAAKTEQVVPIAEARRGHSSVIAGWVVAQNGTALEISDGTARIPVAAPRGMRFKIGDLLLGRLDPAAGIVSDVRIVAQPVDGTVAARIQNWSAANPEDQHRFRYLALREPEKGVPVRTASDMRWRVADFFRQRGFTYVDTPLLGRTQGEYTDDDYVVVSRYCETGVFTLPQSAQFYKQLAMGSGIWKYFQFSKCLRDEPIRSDSLTEFTQIDVEMAFTSQEALMHLMEEFVAEMFLQVGGHELARPFARMSISEAFDNYGCDKPALPPQGNVPVAMFVTDIPMARHDECGRLKGYHHPMTAPDPRHLPLQTDDDLTRIRSTAFDLVIGGIEIGSGNMRVADPALQLDLLDRFGVPVEDREALMGTLVRALGHGFPPHGGFGIGFERMLMSMSRRHEVSDFCAFPRLSKDFCPLTESPFVPKRNLVQQFAEGLARLHPGADAKVAPALQEGERAVSPTAEIARRIAQRGGCQYPLHIGDSHLPPPESFARTVELLCRDAEVLRYSQPGGTAPFREALAARVSAAASRSISPARVLVSNGATEATQAVIRSVMRPGDRATVLSPSWSLIRNQLQAQGCIVDELDFFQACSCTHQVRSLLDRSIPPTSRLLYFANPNNPDGTVLGRDLLASVLEFVADRGLWVIVDEVHEEQVYFGRKHVSAHRIAPDYPRLITVHSFSKLFGLPGVRVGYLVAPREQVSAIERVLQHSSYCVPEIWQRACLNALDDTAFLTSQREQFELANSGTAAVLQRPAVPGGIYHFFPVRADSSSVAQNILQDLDVALMPGSVGGERYSSWLRLCFTAVPTQDAIRATHRVVEWLCKRNLLSSA